MNPSDGTMGTKEHCPVARTLDIIGDRWTILILRDTHADGKWDDNLKSLPGASKAA